MKYEPNEINVKDADRNELNCYKIALYQVIINCNDQLARIKIKLDKIEKEAKKKK